MNPRPPDGLDRSEIDRNDFDGREVDRSEIDRNEVARHDHNIVLDQFDDDWAWRRKLRSNPTTARLYRLAIGVLGALIVIGGLLLVPLPGPGWLIVFAGLAIWASEFEWAQRLLEWVRAKVRAWNDWIRTQALWLQTLAALATALMVIAVIWALLLVSGVPTFLPDAVESFLHAKLGL